MQFTYKLNIPQKNNSIETPAAFKYSISKDMAFAIKFFFFTKNTILCKHSKYMRRFSVIIGVLYKR